MFRLLVAVVLLAGLLQGQTTSPEQALKEAMQRQQAGDFEGAIPGYKQFLVVHPQELAVHSNLGVIYAHLGRYDDAIDQYKQAADLDPNNGGVLLNLGLAYYKSGRVAEAIPTFMRASDLAPENSQPRLLLADCYLRIGQNKNVIELLLPDEKRNSGDLAIAYLMGMALIRDGQVRDGQSRVDKILRNGDSAESRFLLGTQMFAAGDFPSAIKQFAAATELNPNLPDLQASYGRALLITGDPDAAVTAFGKELGSDPNHFEANFYLAQILTTRQKWDQAAPLARRAMTARSDSLEAKLLMADVQIGERHWPLAEQTLEEVQKVSPQSTAVHQRLLRVYEATHATVAAQRERLLLNKLRSSRQNGALSTGDPAPEFVATKSDSKNKVSFSQLRRSGPILLIFGSYTCPNFRGAAAVLNQLYSRYKNEIPFYLIYIREAHSSSDWMSTQNRRESITLPPAATMAEQQEHATMCVRKLHIEFPTLVDAMDGAAERAYSAWPSKAVIVDRHGRIQFSTGLSEQDFDGPRFEAALRKIGGGVAQLHSPQGTQ
jgi:tetratricopeptide (TPR) repeat protein